jgi:hypothetical protein
MTEEYSLEIESGGVNRPPIILAYGIPGIGKTSFGAAAPSPIFVQCEDGRGILTFDAYPVARSFNNVMAALRDLYKNPKGYQTIIFDNLSRLEQIVHEELRREHGDAIFASFGRGAKLAMPYFERLMASLTALRDDKGLMVVVLAHSKVSTITPPDSDPYDRYDLDLDKSAQKIFDKWAESIFFLTEPKTVKKVEGEYGAKRGRAIKGTGRIIHTSNSPASLAKNRFKLDDIIEFNDPFDWTDLMEKINVHSKGEK